MPAMPSGGNSFRNEFVIVGAAAARAGEKATRCPTRGKGQHNRRRNRTSSRRHAARRRRRFGRRSRLVRAPAASKTAPRTRSSSITTCGRMPRAVSRRGPNIELRCRAHNAYEAALFFGWEGAGVVRETRVRYSSAGGDEPGELWQ
jgi:hypothetical protein